MAAGGAIVLAVAAFFLAFGSSSNGTVAVVGGSSLGAVASNNGPSSSGADSGIATASQAVLIVEIVGAIEHPGVFRLPRGSRIGDLVAAGGGYSPRVDADRAGLDLNLAAPLSDGDQVRVPSRDDRPSSAIGPAGAKASRSPGEPLDLNSATAAQLDALPGIGPVTAAKIIASRDQQPFTAVQDLRTRKLLGEKTFANLKDLVAVR